MSDGIVKTGAPVNGRQYYYYSTKPSQKFSIPEENVDKFEKIHKQMAQSLEEAFAIDGKNNAKEIANSQKKCNLAGIAGGVIGAIVPAGIAIAVRGSVLKRTIIGGIASIIGAITGGLGGFFLSASAVYTNMVKKNPKYNELMELQKQADALGIRQEK